MNEKIIAFYLPQYHATPLNNKWYGEGFTEWTNVGKAKPLFRGHYQPKVPADLGYYDLRYPEIREAQAQLAKYAGIHGFCYYHYWFGQGRLELNTPFEEVVRSGAPDYPFCLCWANQSWYSKFWNNDIECEQKLIVEQKYDDAEWRQKHFEYLLPAFKDERYIRINGKVLFMIYRPLEYADISIFIEDWRKLADENQLGGIYFVAQATNDVEAKKIIELGFDGVNIVRKDDFMREWKYSNVIVKWKNKLMRAFGLAPYHYDYKKIYSSFVRKKGIETRENIFPTLIPNWDHSPRSEKRGSVFYNSTPENFALHVQDVMDTVRHKTGDNNLVFLKSWNEWGEGNYVEPCLRYGRGYLDVLRKR